MIRMEHPKLPGQYIWTRPGGVPSRRRSGWREAPEPEPQPAAEQQPEPKSTRRRRTVTTEEERNGTAEAHHD